jgi:hypothetical protein
VERTVQDRPSLFRRGYGPPFTTTLEHTMDRAEVLLAEYGEAGEVSRAHEQNVRQALNAYLVIAAAIVAVCSTDGVSNPGRAWLCFFGLAAGTFILNTVFRHRAYYRLYIARAKAIEAELGMKLYTQAWEGIRSSRTFSNKVAIAAVLVVLMSGFGLFMFIFAFKS